MNFLSLWIKIKIFSNSWVFLRRFTNFCGGKIFLSHVYLPFSKYYLLKYLCIVQFLKNANVENFGKNSGGNHGKKIMVILLSFLKQMPLLNIETKFSIGIKTVLSMNLLINSTRIQNLENSTWPKLIYFRNISIIFEIHYCQCIKLAQYFLIHLRWLPNDCDIDVEWL